MTQKEQAKKLHREFYVLNDTDDAWDVGRQSALICVEQILKSDPLSPSGNFESYEQCEGKAYDYWTEVKCEGELEVYHTSVSNKILYTACNKCNRKHNISYYKKPKK